MSHAKINEISTDDYKCSVSDFDSTNEIAFGKDISAKWICSNFVPSKFVDAMKTKTWKKYKEISFHGTV